MRLSILVSSIALLAGLALATPVDNVERSASILKVVPGAVHPENIVHSNAVLHSSGVGHPDMHGQTVGVSKRTEYNELEPRAIPLLIACTLNGCTGSCTSYTLNIPAYTCYTISGFTSIEAFSPSGAGFGFGLYVGTNCAGTLVPSVNTCLNISPVANTYYIN